MELHICKYGMQMGLLMVGNLLITVENYPELFAKTGNPWQFWNITGWDSEHLGSHPFDDFVIIQPSWQHPEAPMRAPIPKVQLPYL